MQIDLYPFRFRSKSSPVQVMRRLDSIAANYTLKLNSVSEQVFRGYTKEELAGIERRFWSASMRAELREKGMIPLSHAKLKMLSRPVPLKTYLYQTQDKPILMSVQLATSNKYPAIAAELWLKSRIRYIDGWIKITTNGTKRASLRATTFAIDIRNVLGIPLPIRWSSHKDAK